jgi:beta-lactamase class A
MIVYSDNNAFMFLTSYVNFIELKKVYTNLRIQNPLETTDDHYLSVQTYESFFRILYNSSYLNRESSDWALELMSQSEFKSGLVAGVPSTVTVAHKFGERIEEKTIQLHDCGIVYYPKHPYLLCVMSQGPSFEFLEASIADISREIYSDIDSQNQKKELLDK